MNSNIFEKLSFWALFLVVVLLPVFCLPFTNIPVETSKGLLLVVGITVSVIFWAISRFLDGKIVFPKSWLLVSGLGIVLAFLLSAIFNGGYQASFFGTMFDIGSFWYIFTGFVLLFMSSMVFRESKQAKILLLGVILSSAIVLIFQCIHLFTPGILSLGILSGQTGNILGSWNALGLFAGFSCLMFLFVMEFFPISRVEKIILGIFILLSILLAIIINFPLVWELLGVFALIIFVYKVSISLQTNEKEEKRKNFPAVSFAVVIVSLLFFLGGHLISNVLPSRLQVSNTEISPSVGATMTITKGVLTHHPVFGIGPNRFGDAWSMYKPAIVNSSDFWDTSFGSGFGLIPTLTATTGVIGILAWIIFLILFLFIGAKSVFSSVKNKANWETVAFFVLSLYLFISSFFYFTGTVMFLLSLSFTGVFIGLIASSSEKEMFISFLNDHRKSFFSILALIILVILSVVISFKYIERFASVPYFGKALSATTEPAAENYINKALSLYSNDLYLRTYSQIFLVKLNSIVNKSSNLSDTDKADLQTSFDNALNGAEMATVYDPSNYLNFQLLGSVYQAFGLLGVKDAYAKSVVSFKDASVLNPLNPGLKLSMAKVSFADGKTQDAKDYANAALSLKGDYVDALVVLSQIAKSENNNSEALSYAKQALSITPTNQDLINYVNSLNNSSSTPASAPETTANKPK